MPEPEEGAAYFDQFAGVVPPRTMGRTQCFPPIRGYGRLGDAAPVPVEATAPSVFSQPTPWLVAAAGAALGFIVARRKK